MGLIDDCKKRFFIKKSVDGILRDLDGTTALKRRLNAFDITMIGVGHIIGAGIFVLIGVALAMYAGPAITISFIIVGAVCIIVALCYAELASMIPISGSVYTYSYATMGELVGWLIGWDLILEYSLGATAVSVGWSGYVVRALNAGGIGFPEVLANAPGEGGIINLPAMLIVLALASILVFGVKESATFNTTLVIIKLSVIIFFIFFGLSFINPANYEDFFPYGYFGIMGGAGLIFFAYVGFDAVSTMAEETENPQKNLPIGIILALVISSVIYISVAFVLSGMISYEQLKGGLTAPLAYAYSENGVPWAAIIVSLGAIIATTTVIFVSLLAQPRIFFSVARDGLLPKEVAKIHPKYGTPYITTIITGIIVSIIAGLTPITVAAELVNIGTLFAFVLVCLGVIILRNKEPNRTRGIKVPFMPYLPLIGAISCIALMLSLPAITWIRFIGWMGVGLLIYSFYGYHNSRLYKELITPPPPPPPQPPQLIEKPKIKKRN